MSTKRPQQEDPGRRLTMATTLIELIAHEAAKVALDRGVVTSPTMHPQFETKAGLTTTSETDSTRLFQLNAGVILPFNDEAPDDMFDESLLNLAVTDEDTIDMLMHDLMKKQLSGILEL